MNLHLAGHTNSLLVGNTNSVTAANHSQPAGRHLGEPAASTTAEMGRILVHSFDQFHGRFSLDTYGHGNQSNVGFHPSYHRSEPRLTFLVAHRFGKINHISDRIQKVVYLLVDASLNFLFVRIVKKELVELGLTKYKRLADFNIRIILLSITMDVGYNFEDIIIIIQ